MNDLVPPRPPIASLVMVVLVAAFGWLLFSGPAADQAAAVAPAARLLGGQTDLGKGTASAYTEMNGLGQPTAIGVVFSAAALDTMPASGSDYHHCFDRNQDGTIDRATECLHSYEHVLPLPDAMARNADVPFKWVLLNWNPAGHIPHGVYDVPHFDVHFFLEPIASIFALQAGPCGPEFIRCDQFAIAKQPARRCPALSSGSAPRR